MKLGKTLPRYDTTRYCLLVQEGQCTIFTGNEWINAVFCRDTFALTKPLEQWAIEFGEAFPNVVTQNSGPRLRRGMSRLMSHPQYRDGGVVPSLQWQCS